MLVVPIPDADPGPPLQGVPSVTMNTTRGDTRADRKEKEEKRVVFLRAGELSTYIPARTLLNHPNRESCHRSITLRQTTL